MEVDDLKLIKKHYGEKMMHLCRELFPTILEEKGVLFNLLDRHFDHSKDLCEDIIKYNLDNSFKKYIYGLFVSSLDNEDVEVSSKTPFELMEEANYDLYECNTEKEIQSFKKYYAEGEELCTFYGNRLQTNHVFFAVKKNINDYRRKDFRFPERQDKYGTSVLSIQFTRGNTNFVSIKNRYNHKVENPDATFSNNLDNIIPGLTESFERVYGFKIKRINSSEFEIPNYVMDRRGKFHKYIMEVNNKYYCKNNIIIDNGEVIDTYKEKEKFIFMDCFILDLQNNKLFAYDKRLADDAFLFGLTGIKKVQVFNIENDHKLILCKLNNDENVYIEVDNENHIVSYINNSIEFVGSNFLMYNEHLEKLQLNNVTKVGYNFLYYNQAIKELDMINLKTVDNFFLRFNNSLEELYLPNVKLVNHDFLEKNRVLKKLSMPNLEFVGLEFLHNNKELTELDLPNLKDLTVGSLQYNECLNKVNLPSIRKVNHYFLPNNKKLESLTLESVTEIYAPFLEKNQVLKELNIPHLLEYNDYHEKSPKNIEVLIRQNLDDVQKLVLK